jgi:glycosyltransferase involved in cell wall biosynthesis
MIARFQPYRRHDLLVEAWVEVARQMPEARLVLIGRGENESRIRNLVKRMDLSESVIFAGYRLDDFPQHVAALDLLVYLRPGSDGSCRTVLEAMAVGRPCLVAPVGALLDLVQDGVTGVVLPEERINALAESIVDLLSSPQKRKQMGERGRQIVERKHTPEHVADFLEEVYGGAIASSGTPEHEA